MAALTLLSGSGFWTLKLIKTRDLLRLLRANVSSKRINYIQLIRELNTFDIPSETVHYQTNWFHHFKRMEVRRLDRRFYLCRLKGETGRRWNEKRKDQM
jgi:hypothetical protein